MKKRKKYTPETNFADKYYLITGGIFLLVLGFYLISIDLAWISLLFSILVSFVSFTLVSRNEKKGWWIFLGSLSIICDVLNLIATIQLFL